MIGCSFCSTQKSEKYIYTVCNHFVCLNCASLRAGQSLKCCNQSTNLNESVKSQLNMKKQIIMNNLSKAYEYERTSIVQQKDDYQEIERNLFEIRNNNNSHKHNYKLNTSKVSTQQKFEEESHANEFKRSPIDQFYKNPLILQQKMIQNHYKSHENQYKSHENQFTPIKLVTNMENQSDCVKPSYSKTNILSTNSQRLQTLENYPQIKNIQQKVQIKSFQPVLQLKIKDIRKSFKEVYDQLQKMQASMIYQTKVYFQEYVKILIQQGQNNQSGSFNSLIEEQRLKKFLNQFTNKWNLSKVKQILQQQTLLKLQSNSIEPSVDKIVLKENHKNTQQSKQKQIQNLLNLQDKYSNSKDLTINRRQKQNLKQLPLSHLVNQVSKSENIEQICRDFSSRKNLDKIYKKLQQSRTKLEQRIYRHNWFMSDRCNNISKA